MTDEPDVQHPGTGSDAAGDEPATGTEGAKLPAAPARFAGLGAAAELLGGPKARVMLSLALADLHVEAEADLGPWPWAWAARVRTENRRATAGSAPSSSQQGPLRGGAADQGEASAAPDRDRAAGSHEDGPTEASSHE